MTTRNSRLYVLCLCLVTMFVACDSKKSTQQEIADTSEVRVAIQLADPCIYQEDGTFYLYGTGGDVNHGFLVYTSTDLTNWEGPKGYNEGGYALVKGDSYGTKGFWAPQVFKHKDKIYIAYTANEQIAIAESDSPLGPFKQKELKKLSGSERQIDPYVFFDDDGKIYMYHVRLLGGNKLFVAEMKADLSDVKQETATLCVEADEAWEDTANADWAVTEGPTVLKHKELYYFFYSANDFRNPDYAVGYATSTSPTGPWMKYAGNPILDRNLISKEGTGHGDFFADKDNNLRYVFHIHNSDSIVEPRNTGIIEGQFITDEAGQDYMKFDNQKFYYPSVKK